MNQFAGELALVLLVVGITLLGVITYLKNQSLKLNRAILQLYRLNHQVNQDVLDFIDQAWDILETFGFEGLYGEIDWFGEEVSYQKGRQTKYEYPIYLHEDEMAIKLRLYHQKLGGEKQMMAEVLQHAFLILLSQDLLSKKSQLNLSYRRLEKYRLFLQHDVKNLAQFIRLLTDQVSLASTDQEKIHVMTRLKELLPAISERSARVVDQFKFDQPNYGDVDMVDLGSLIEELAKGLELRVNLVGDAKVLSSKNLVKQIIVTLLENFKDHQQQDFLQALEVHLNQRSSIAEVTILQPGKLSEVVKAERMFEPFWTTSEGGMGLGLYITRELLKISRGEIHFIEQDGCYGFKAVIPAIPQE